MIGVDLDESGEFYIGRNTWDQAGEKTETSVLEPEILINLLYGNLGAFAQSATNHKSDSAST